MGNRTHALQASFSGDAVKMTTYADDTVVSGNGFLFEKNFAIAAGATLLILFDYTTYIPTENWQKGTVYITRPLFQTTAGPVTVKLYRGTNYTGGTEFKAYNPNTVATKTECATTLTTGPTGTTKGTVNMEYIVGGEGLGAHTASGVVEGMSFFISNNKRKALVEITNTGSTDAVFHYGQGLFEI